MHDTGYYLLYIFILFIYFYLNIYKTTQMCDAFLACAMEALVRIGAFRAQAGKPE